MPGRHLGDHPGARQEPDCRRGAANGKALSGRRRFWHLELELRDAGAS